MRHDKATMRHVSLKTLKSSCRFLIAFGVLLHLALRSAPCAWSEDAAVQIDDSQSILKSILFGFDNVHQIFANCSAGNVSFDRLGRQADSPAMRWDVNYQPGQSSFCKKRYNTRRFKGGERMRFYTRSSAPGFMLVELEEEKGEVFYSVVPVGTEWSLISLKFSNFKVLPRTQQDGVLDRKKILRVIIEDPSAFFGARGNRTLWFSEWFVDAFDLSLKSRPYYLGFMQWPTVGAFQKQIPVSDELIRDHADLIAFHIDGGVPWLEALDNRLLSSPSLMQAVADGKAKIPAGDKVYVAINPLNGDRNGLAPYWNGTDQSPPLPQEWGAYPLNHVNVKIAFLNYAKWIIEQFKPDYLVIGVEVNIPMARNYKLWQQYIELHQYVYAALKRAYPQLPIFASFQYDLIRTTAGKDSLRDWQTAELAKLLPYCDVLGLSAYPFAGVIPGPQPLPDGYFDVALAFGKPIGLTETSYPSHDFTVSGYTLAFSPQDQQLFLEALLKQAGENNFRFIISNVSQDFDQALLKWPAEVQQFLIWWAYDGLQDSSGQYKPALDFWDAYLKLPKRSAFP